MLSGLRTSSKRQYSKLNEADDLLSTSPWFNTMIWWFIKPNLDQDGFLAKSYGNWTCRTESTSKVVSLVVRKGRSFHMKYELRHDLITAILDVLISPKISKNNQNRTKSNQNERKNMSLPISET